jgi:hypothetical protein
MRCAVIAVLLVVGVIAWAPRPAGNASEGKRGAVAASNRDNEPVLPKTLASQHVYEYAKEGRDE